MESLQELSLSNQLPTININAIPNDQLSKEHRDKQAEVGGGGNEAIYTLFSNTMDSRSQVSSFDFFDFRRNRNIILTKPIRLFISVWYH